jgi:hypothetical protein
MATTIGKLAAVLSVNTSKFSKGMRGAMQTMSRMANHAKRVAKITTGIGIAAAGTAATIGTLAVRRQLDYVDSLAKTADKIGATTEGLARMRYAAGLAGVDIRTLDMGMQRFVRRAAEAAIGTGEAKDAIKTLGIDAARISKMKPQDALLELSDAFMKVENQAQRVRLAFKLFDSEGVALVNILTGGRNAIENAYAAADRFGLSLSRVDAAQVEGVNNALHELGSAVARYRAGGYGRVGTVSGSRNKDVCRMGERREGRG